MDSMADLTRKLGWIAWCLTVIGWFLSPIISLLVNKIFVCLVFNTSEKLKELENEIIRELKKKLSAVEEQTVLRSAEDKGSLKVLESMKMDLKSALYEAEDILDLLDYHRIEKDLHCVGDHDSRWVENQLCAACVWIARCKGSSVGRWIHVTLVAAMKSAQSMIRQGQLVIQGWPHFELFSICRSINIVGVAVLQCAQSWYQQLGQLFSGVILTRSGGPLLPVSSNSTGQPPSLQSRDSVLVPADAANRPTEEMVDEEDIVEETQVEETEESTDAEEVGETPSEEEIVQETHVQEGEGDKIQDAEEGAMLQDTEEESSEGEDDDKETEEESTEGEEAGETSLEEDTEEDDKEGKEGDPTSSPILQYFARPMLTWFAKACFYRDWSYGIVGIRSDKKGASALESLVQIAERINLKNRIKHIEDILNTSKKSDLLTEQNSSSGATKDIDKESSSKQKEIDDMHRNIDQKVFGREEDRAHISRMLRDGPDDDAASSSISTPYSVIGIYGITGSGKSTLAQYVCDYEKEAGHFNLIIFILVGKTFSVADIFHDMLEQIKQESRSSNDKDLKSRKTELCENLKNKRFLLVLDDVWVDDDKWKERDILLDTLNAAASGSRILVTAQKKDAAEALGAQEQISIPELEEEVYLSLFMHHARPHAPDAGVEFEQIGRKIANRLCRSPIAAVTVGKQLQRNKSISFWQATASLDVLNKTMGALFWSYQQLGDDIRRCFAYCSTFPKGYRLKQDELVRIWIAQGFVSTSCNATDVLEAIGQHYFHQLLSFSFLQTQGKVLSLLEGDTEEFTIHDLLHELAEKVSGSEFFRIGVNGSPEDIPRKVHHLFVETKNLAEINEKILDLGNLRTLIINEDRYDSGLKFTNVKRNHELERLLERLFMRLKELRVLIINVNLLTEEFSVPASIDQIKHLRYLAFPFRRGLVGLILPSTFSKLYHIQTIDIESLQTSCPEDMANLVHLRHTSAPLYFPNIGRLTSLQTLEGFRVKEEQGYELNQLKHLNKLRGSLSIVGLGNVKRKEEAIEANLAQKEELRELRLNFSRSKGNPDVVAEVLEGLCPPMHLEKLSIQFYNGSRYPRWMLSRHYSETAPKHLQKLLLWGCSQLASIPEDSELFIGLCELDVMWCDWDRLPQNMERLVSLQTLKICRCKKMKLLGTLPHQSLKNITICDCGVLSKTCKEEGHENWRQIQHIPNEHIW